MGEFLSYGFVQRGLLAGSLVAAACALIGVFLVLKRLSLIGDGMSHVCLTGVAAALLTSTNPVYMSVPVVVLASLGIMKITQKFKIYGDAAIGIVSAAGLSVGLLITAFAGGFNTDLLGYLFGSILTVSWDEAVLCGALLLAVLAALFFFYRAITSARFDEPFARTRGVKVDAVNTGLVVLPLLPWCWRLKWWGFSLFRPFLSFRRCQPYWWRALLSKYCGVRPVLAWPACGGAFTFPLCLTFRPVPPLFWSICSF